MNDPTQDTPTPDEAQPDSPGLVPVAESIKYRRRAQQAERRAEELERRLAERADQLATAEAQRDEAAQQLAATENRAAAERMLTEAGVADLEAASLLLARRVDLAQPAEGDSLRTAVEQLLLDKPFLRSAAPQLPPTSAGERGGAPLGAQLAQAADRAARQGDRRSIANYLRLRRQAAS